jgi:hypothetical protein
MTTDLPGETATHEIFLSYAREDRDRARIVAEALARQGVAVWWDTEIVPGRNWQNEINQAIRSARRVIVLWSRHAITSDWVRAEASQAFQEGKLIPVLLEHVELPVPFNSIQALDLSQWRGEEDAADFRPLLDGIGAHTGRAAGPAVAEGESRWKAAAVSWAWILLPSLVVGGLALGLMNWRAPADVEIDVAASRVRFHSAGNDQRELFGSVAANAITLSGFAEVTLPVSQAAAANPLKWDDRADAYPEDAWVAIPADDSLALRATGGPAAQVTVRPVAPSAGVLLLERIFTGAAAITLASTENGVLNAELRGPRLSGTVTLPESVRIDVENCARDEGALPFPGPSATLRARVPPQRRLLEYSSGGPGMAIVLEVPETHQNAALLRSSFPVDEVEFLDHGPTGLPVSTLVGAGTVRYRDYSNIPPVALKKADFLYLGGLRSFYLRELSFAAQGTGFQMRFQGVAGKVTSGEEGALRDRRLTRFEMLWNSQKAVALFTILGWLIATSLALRKYLKDYAPGGPRPQR